MAETKTSLSELTAATTVAAGDLLFVSQQSGSAWNSRKATVSQLPFGQGTITGITMNGASKGTSGNVNLGTVLTAHQSLTGYAPTSRKVNNKQLTADITLNAADVSAVALTGNSAINGTLSVRDEVYTPYITYNNEDYGIAFDDARYTAYFWNPNGDIILPKTTTYDQIVLSSNLANYCTKPDIDSVFDYLGIKCCSPETVAVSNNGTVYRINVVGELNQQTLDNYPPLARAKTIVFGTNVTSIAAETFKNNNFINEIIVPTSVSAVGISAFTNSHLSSVIAVGWERSAINSILNWVNNIPKGCEVSVQNIAFKEWVDQNYSPTSHTHAEYVPTSRTVAGQQLTANVTAATISSAIGLGNYSLTSHNHSGVYLEPGNRDSHYYSTLTALSSNDYQPPQNYNKWYAAQANDGSLIGGMVVQVLSSYSGQSRLYFFSRRKVNGSNVNTEMNLYSNSDGTRSTTLNYDPPADSNGRQLATTQWTRNAIDNGLTYYSSVAAGGVLQNHSLSRCSLTSAPSGNKVRFYLPKYVSNSSRHFYLSFNNSTSAVLSVYFQSQSGETQDTLWATPDTSTFLGSGPFAAAKNTNYVVEFTEFASRALEVDIRHPSNKSSQLTAY